MIEDVLERYGVTVEEASEMEEDYHEYQQKFTNNRLYQKVVSELMKEMFDKFCSGDKEVAHEAYHEMQGLKKVLSRLSSIEADYHKVQAIKETDSAEDY